MTTYRDPWYRLSREYLEENYPKAAQVIDGLVEERDRLVTERDSLEAAFHLQCRRLDAIEAVITGDTERFE